MILKYFYPEEDYSWKELDELSAKVEGLWTWPTAALIWLKRKGLQMKVITPFDYDSFIAEGGSFLIRKYGEEVGKAQIAHSNIDQEQELAKSLLLEVPIEKRIPDIAEICELLQEGYLVACNVNAFCLDQKEGYAGHFVVIKGFERNELILHDPGQPARPDRHVNIKVFESAWAYPNEEAKDIYAFKRE